MRSIICFLVVATLLSAGCRRNGNNNIATAVVPGDGIPSHEGTVPVRGYRALTASSFDGEKVLVSWRFLPGDPDSVSFDLYRESGGGKIKLNAAPLSSVTNFEDTEAPSGVDREYILCASDSGETLERFTLSADAKPYISIPMSVVAGSDLVYAPGDACVGDLDGDGIYEIVVKREVDPYPQAYPGLCRGTMLLEAYRLTGELLWRMDMGVNIRQGAHYNSFSVYDYDGDGRAEVALRTSEGTVFGDGAKIGDTDGDGITDYVIRTESPEKGQRDTYGKILSGPEFLSVIEGTTGRELARTDYIARGKVTDWGDEYGNRSDIFLSGLGRFGGGNTSILICRGVYAKTVLEAWDYAGGRLTRRWRFDTTADNGKYKAYEEQGSHSLRIGDVDGDGLDEVVTAHAS